MTHLIDLFYLAVYHVQQTLHANALSTDGIRIIKSFDFCMTCLTSTMYSQRVVSIPKLIYFDMKIANREEKRGIHYLLWHVNILYLLKILLKCN